MNSDLSARAAAARAAGGSATPGGARILLVEDERMVRESLAAWLAAERYEVVGVASMAEALAELERGPFDVLITDVILEDGDGLDLLGLVCRRWPETVALAISGYGTVELAVQAIKLGAFDFLRKPLRVDELRQVVRRAVQQGGQRRAGRAPGPAAALPFGPDTIIGRTHQMQRVFALIEAVADSKATVLIHGETGTGKSLAARAIHHASQRRARPFVEVSCGAIPETLLESELFGHVKGAFTGALADKDGKFRAADGGTIFLDEVSAASPSLQVKLLRVLQDRQFEPLGSNRTRTVDVRVLLATNTDLQQLVADGRFRRDLFYRINVVNLELPPLRERLSDIPLLAEHFLRKYAQQSGRSGLRFSDEVMQLMQRYHWPGNVRELENCIERAVILTRGDRIRPADLPPAIVQACEASPSLFAAGSGRQLTLREALAEPERRIIQSALEANGWNRQKTAAALAVNRTTLYKKMRRYGLLGPRRPGRE